ncbi:hypothetical protein LTS18_002788, partial [Coniosporium uncinatum]
MSIATDTPKVAAIRIREVVPPIVYLTQLRRVKGSVVRTPDRDIVYSATIPPYIAVNVELAMATNQRRTYLEAHEAIVNKKSTIIPIASETGETVSAVNMEANRALSLIAFDPTLERFRQVRKTKKGRENTRKMAERHNDAAAIYYRTIQQDEFGQLYPYRDR